MSILKKINLYGNSKMKIFLILTYLVAFVNCHIEMKYPPPRHSKFSKYTEIDYNLKSPLYQGEYPCKKYNIGKPEVVITNRSIKVELYGTAIHNGGHCFFSLSYDNKNFVVIKTIVRNCMLTGMSYDIVLPKNIKNGNVIFAWSWVNSIGNREYYMNCADIRIDIKNNLGTGVIRGRELFVCNLPDVNNIVIPEFPLKTMYSGIDLIKKQRRITIKN